VARWCDARGVGRGATLTIDQVWSLSQRWYGSRLDPHFRRPTVDEAHEIFASVGLTSDFWKLQ
jgi:hypothetical protein